MRDAVTASIERLEASVAYEEWAEAHLPVDDDEAARQRSMAAHPAGKGLADTWLPKTWTFPAELAQVIDLDLYATRRRQLDQVDEPDDFELAVLEATDELTDVLLAKHKDYGPGNIAGSPGGPLNGLRVRLYDKLARINNLVETGAGPANEPLRDSFLDLANYALIGLLVLDGNWPSA
jgi:hypothetical protein